MPVASKKRRRSGAFALPSPSRFVKKRSLQRMIVAAVTLAYVPTATPRGTSALNASAVILIVTIILFVIPLVRSLRAVPPPNGKAGLPGLASPAVTDVGHSCFAPIAVRVIESHAEPQTRDNVTNCRRYQSERTPRTMLRYVANSTVLCLTAVICLCRTIATQRQRALAY